MSSWRWRRARCVQRAKRVSVNCSPERRWGTETNDLHLHRARETEAFSVVMYRGRPQQIRPSQACSSKYERWELARILKMTSDDTLQNQTPIIRTITIQAKHLVCAKQQATLLTDVFSFSALRTLREGSGNFSWRTKCLLWTQGGHYIIKQLWEISLKEGNFVTRETDVQFKFQRQ